MARVRVHKESKLGWLEPGEQAPESDVEEFTEGELTAKVRIREAGSADRLQLIEIYYAPHAEVQLHAHEEDEVIYVRSGEMHAGSQVLGPGDSIFIAGGTFYAFRAGAEGLQMLNFRPRQDVTFFTRRDSLRKSAPAG